MNRMLFTKYFNPDRMVVLYAVIVSIVANVYFYFTLNSYAVGNGDAWSRLNIARRVVDSLTPGIVQLGGIWLPFPQLLLVPFAAIDWIYYSGIAGLFISTPAFIIGGIYLYKSLYKLVESKSIAFFGFFLYANNLNLLYMQTTTMSEILFIASVLGAVYHYIKWVEDIKVHLLHLILAAFWIMIATLTRYEGFLLFACMTLCVILTTLFKTRKFKIMEGLTLLFATLAGFGIFLWILYSWVIFGHPLNWLRIYRGEIASVATVTEKPLNLMDTANYRGNLEKSIISVVESSFQMNGLLLIIPVSLGVIIYIFQLFFVKKHKKQLLNLSILCITSMPVFFLINSSFNGTALITNPPVDVAMLFNTNLYQSYEYNIRYGLLTFPFVIFFSTIAFSSHRMLKGIFICLSILQSFIFFTGNPVTIYSLPHKYLDIGAKSDNRFVNWFHQHYDGGLILTSAMVNDPVMYSLKIPYKTYIYEGTGNYWKAAIVNPAKYAKWILLLTGPKVIDTAGAADFVNFYLQDTEILNSNYDLVYKDNLRTLYKIKNSSQISNNVQKN